MDQLQKNQTQEFLNQIINKINSYFENALFFSTSVDSVFGVSVISFYQMLGLIGIPFEDSYLLFINYQLQEYIDSRFLDIEVNTGKNNEDEVIVYCYFFNVESNYG